MQPAFLYKPLDETYKRIANIDGFDGILKILERAKHFWGMHVEIITNLIPGIALR